MKLYIKLLFGALGASAIVGGSIPLVTSCFSGRDMTVNDWDRGRIADFFLENLPGWKESSFMSSFKHWEIKLVRDVDGQRQNLSYRFEPVTNTPDDLIRVIIKFNDNSKTLEISGETYGFLRSGVEFPEEMKKLPE